MKADLQFDFLVDEEQKTMTIRKEFAAKRQRVWDCYTKSELLDRWFAPKPLTTETGSMDFREGGHWHYAMVEPDGNKHWARLDYQSINPIDGFEALDGFCDSSGALNPDLPRSHWNVTFTDAGERSMVQTVVTYASSDDLKTVVAMGMKDGMTSTLERLDELLATLAK